MMVFEGMVSPRHFSSLTLLNSLVQHPFFLLPPFTLIHPKNPPHRLPLSRFGRFSVFLGFGLFFVLLLCLCFFDFIFTDID